MDWTRLVSQDKEGAVTFDYDNLNLSDRINFSRDLEIWAGETVNLEGWGRDETLVRDAALDQARIAISIAILEAEAKSDYAFEEKEVAVDEETCQMIINAFLVEWHDQMAEDELTKVMTAAEVAEEFGIAHDTVRVSIHRGYIPARKSGGTWLIRRSDAEKRWGNS